MLETRCAYSCLLRQAFRLENFQANAPFSSRKQVFRNLEATGLTASEFRNMDIDSSEQEERALRLSCPFSCGCRQIEAYVSFEGHWRRYCHPFPHHPRQRCNPAPLPQGWPFKTSLITPFAYHCRQ
jgi:hypothetical protein